MSGMLWYRHPARLWVEALPLGKGRIGTMAFGGVNCAERGHAVVGRAEA